MRRDNLPFERASCRRRCPVWLSGGLHCSKDGVNLFGAEFGEPEVITDLLRHPVHRGTADRHATSAEFRNIGIAWNSVADRYPREQAPTPGRHGNPERVAGIRQDRAILNRHGDLMSSVYAALDAVLREGVAKVGVGGEVEVHGAVEEVRSCLKARCRAYVAAGTGREF